MSTEVLQPFVVSLKEAARLLSSTTFTLRRLAKRGEIAHSRVGARIMFQPEDLRNFLTSTRVKKG